MPVNRVTMKLAALMFLLQAAACVLSAQGASIAVPAIDPAATAIWQQHIEGMGARGEAGAPVNFDQISGKALEFFEKYPDERRVGGILYNLLNCGDWMQGDRAAELRSGWLKHLDETLADALANHSWPDNVWAGLNWVAGRNRMAIDVDARGQPDLKVLAARIATVAGRAPASPYRTFLEQAMVHALEKQEPARLEPYLNALAASEIPDLAALGSGQLAILDLRRNPMELSFTALDGRKFDLRDLRGKVVLIDCWATWCVPCVKELPNIKEALAKWGASGFEVVGITFDKIADKSKLEKFIADEKLTWPQWFNEKGGSHPFGKRFNIRSIPATFLLDRDGRLITTETHGDLLEAALARVMIR